MPIESYDHSQTDLFIHGVSIDYCSGAHGSLTYNFTLLAEVGLPNKRIPMRPVSKTIYTERAAQFKSVVVVLDRLTNDEFRQWGVAVPRPTVRQALEVIADR